MVWDSSFGVSGVVRKRISQISSGFCMAAEQMFTGHAARAWFQEHGEDA